MSKCRVVFLSDGKVVVIHPVSWNRKIDLYVTFMQPFPADILLTAIEITMLMELKPKQIIHYFSFYGLPVAYLETEQEWLERTFIKATGNPQYNKVGQQINPLFGRPFDDIDNTELPTRDENRDKWRGSKDNGVHIDHSIVLPREQIETKQAELDTELEKQSPDSVMVIKLHRELEKLKAQK